MLSSNMNEDSTAQIEEVDDESQGGRSKHVKYNS
jgi:hypothetical protein